MLFLPASSFGPISGALPSRPVQSRADPDIDRKLEDLDSIKSIDVIPNSSP